MTLLWIFLPITIIVIRSNFNKLTGKTYNNETKDVETMVPLKYLSNFWRTFEMSFINFEISLMLAWSKNCFLIASTLENQNPKFTITYKTFCSCFNFINSR